MRGCLLSWWLGDVCKGQGIGAIGGRKRCGGMGAGEVVVNSIDTDGVKGGFDLPMLEAVCEAVRVPVIASGGAGCAGDFTELFRRVPEVSAGLAASIFTSAR